MIRRSLALLLFCFATLCRAADPAAASPCTAVDVAPARLARDEHGGTMKIDRCYRYADRTGDFRLYLLATFDRQDVDDTLSSSLAAQLFRKQPDGTLVQQWVIHDRIEPGEAGARFSKTLIEFRDLDGDGTLTPILVLRFVPFERGGDGPVDDTAFSGRLKFILFRGGAKVAIRAVTGMLDDERHTTASDSFFELPRQQQLWLQKKMRTLSHEGLFTFDDVGDYRPRREKHR